MVEETFETLRFERKDDVARITLARPDRLNAQTPKMWAELRSVGAGLADTGLRCLLISGDGRAFSSGLDTQEQREGGAIDRGADLAASDADRVVSNILRVQTTFQWIHDAPYVTIAAVQGYALGAGMQLALACDLRIAAEDAVFSLPELALLGVVPDMCGTAWLPQIIGRAAAKELIFLGDRVEASEALRLGLVNRVVPLGELASTVDAMTGRIAALPPIAVRHAKASIDAGSDEESHRLAAQGTAACMRSEDFREAARARREERKPIYQGR
jgi:enoyl-CoA hydratase